MDWPAYVLRPQCTSTLPCSGIAGVGRGPRRASGRRCRRVLPTHRGLIRTLRVAAVPLLALLLSSPGAAQQGRGSISGTVSDATGAAVPDATVTITNVGTQATFVAVTNSTGFYTAPSLPVGEYAVSAEKTGF